MTQQGQGDVVAQLTEWVRNAGGRESTGFARLIEVDVVADAADEITRLRTLLSSSRGGQGWRTIDSAPKDGRKILGLIGEDEVGTIWWHRDAYEGEWWMDEADSEPEPTHWMPLPSAPGSVPTSLAGQVPNGYVLVPKEPTLEVERSIAYAVAVARQGASSTPRFESPTEYDIDTARAWVRWVVAALSERFSVPPPRDGHSRDCEYVTTDGPAPCTCGFVERDCNAAVARAALQSSPQPTAGASAPSLARGISDDEPECCPRCGNAWEPPDLSALANGIDRSIKLALSAERARVIEMCAKHLEKRSEYYRNSYSSVHDNSYLRHKADVLANEAAAIRALGQQDTK